MSKAPRIQPPNTCVYDKTTNKTIYTYWREGRLKNGDIVFHKQTVIKNIKDSNEPRKERSDKKDIADSQHKQNIQKRKLVNSLKRAILDNNDYTYLDVQNLCEKFKSPKLIQALCC